MRIREPAFGTFAKKRLAGTSFSSIRTTQYAGKRLQAIAITKATIVHKGEKVKRKLLKVDEAV